MIKKTGLSFLMLIIFIMISGCGAEDKAVKGDVADMLKVGDIYGIPMDELAAVVTDTVVDIYDLPDIKSQRITQAIYNQPVRILEEKEGWMKVVVVDGRRGWVRSKFIDRNVASIYGGVFTHRIIITSKEKSVYSQPSGGITLKDVVMGTELYAFNDAGDTYEVYLPGNATGWLRGSGMIHVDMNKKLAVTKAEDFISTALKYKGTSYLLKGASSRGIDSTGLVYVCARINGINLSADIQNMITAGKEVKLDDVIEGDLIFLSTGEDNNELSCVGIYTGSGNYIYASKTAGYVTIGSLKENNADGKPFTGRRIFDRQ